jgi:hypothetical protein
MTKKRMLADVLWDAANKHLSANNELNYQEQRDYFSCVAVEFSCGNFKTACTAKEFLQKLGCPTDSAMQFLQFREGAQRQGIRYLWLLLAMHVAEEEGITV